MSQRTAEGPSLRGSGLCTNKSKKECNVTPRCTWKKGSAINKAHCSLKSYRFKINNTQPVPEAVKIAEEIEMSPWKAYVSDFMERNPGMKLGEASKLASEEYKNRKNICDIRYNDIDGRVELRRAGDWTPASKEEEDWFWANPQKVVEQIVLQQGGYFDPVLNEQIDEDAPDYGDYASDLYDYDANTDNDYDVEDY